MKLYRYITYLFLALLYLFVLPLHAATSLPFTEDAFIELQEQGKPVLIDVRADWCPTCRKQSEILKTFLTQNPQCDLTILDVDFDEQKQWVKHFGAPRQSTLILFDGKERVWFSVAETREDIISKAIHGAVRSCANGA